MSPLTGRDLVLAATTALALSCVIAALISHIRLRRLQRRRDEERRLTEMGGAVARILHQVKNPLQTIILHADLLQEPKLAADAAARAVASRAIASEADRLAAMLAELSAYAAGAGRVMRREPVALHEMVREVAGSESRNTGLSVECAPVEECTVRADAFYLRQALENLVANAREAMRGQEDARLMLRLERRDGSAVVGVIDTGPGVPAAAAETIFQPFVSGKSGGMGLGLAIAREIVEEHGGRIEVRSVEGEGSHFRVFIPLDATGPSG
jgi:signal transduction histidine kinase